MHDVLEMSHQWKAKLACACMYLLNIAAPPGAARSLQLACRGLLIMGSDAAAQCPAGHRRHA